MLGTPSYMAPEQLSSALGRVSPATDVYALGALLYVLLTSKLPFPGETVLETFDLIRTVQPTPPSSLKRDLPRELELICLKCLAKAPTVRYAAAGELLTDLLAYQYGKPTQAGLEAKSSLNASIRPKRNGQTFLGFVNGTEVKFQIYYYDGTTSTMTEPHRLRWMSSLRFN